MPHAFAMPPDYTRRVVARQGRAHTVERIHGPSTALVVVDMQKYFMSAPFPGACPIAVEVVPNVNRLAGAVRAAGGQVVWLQMMTPPADEESWTAVRVLYSDAAAPARWRALRPGTEGFELWPDLDVAEGDARIVKNRYSAFIPGSSEISAALPDVETLLVAGVATNVCVESTARDAMMLNHRVVIVSDACAAATDEEHAASLGNFYLFFGDVQTTEQLVALLETTG